MEKVTLMDKFNSFLAQKSFSIAERLKFYRKLYAFINEGIPTYDAIETLLHRYEVNKDYKKQIMAQILKDMDSGESFPTAMSKWIPSQDAALIYAGDASAKLNEALLEVISLSEKSKELKGFIKSTVYPSIAYLVVLFLVIIFFSVHMAPQFRDTLPEEYWSVITVSYFSFSDFIGNNFAFILLFIGGLIAFFLTTVSRYHGPGRKILDVMPGYKTYRVINSGYFLITLSGMMKTGATFDDSIHSIKKFMPPYIQSHLRKSISLVAGGSEPGESLSTGFLPKDVAADVEDFGKLAGFARGIEAIGRMIIEDISQKLKSVAGFSKVLVFLSIALYLVWTIFALGSAGLNMQEAAQMGTL